MGHPTINTQRVISAQAGLNKGIVGRISYHVKDDGYYFIEESILKERIMEILSNPKILDSLSKMYATEDDYNTYINSNKIIVEDFQLRDPTTPETVIDLNF